MYKSLLALCSLAGLSMALPSVKVHPTPPHQVGPHTLEITHENTLNATSMNRAKPKDDLTPLPIAMVNNLAGSVNAYITGLDDNGALFFVQADGTPYYPPNPPAGGAPTEITADIAIPLGAQGSTTTVNLNQYISSARVWFAEGSLIFYTNNGANGPSLVEPSAVNPSDPNAGTNWGFAELTWNSSQLYANISYVDFVGLAIGMLLAVAGGSSQNVGGLPAGAVATICSALSQQASSDGQPWDQLCMTDSSGNPLRVLSPNNILSGVDTAFANYWTDYVNQVYSTYASSNLTINSQTGYGDLVGEVVSGSFSFDDNAGTFGPPGPGDIFGCNSGPFANSGNTAHLSIVSRLCAAFNRGTLLLSDGATQPDGPSVSEYYTTSPCNHYSRIVHATELNGQGYAFAYDDVIPDGGPNISGAVSSGSPQQLTITVGGPSS